MKIQCAFLFAGFASVLLPGPVVADDEQQSHGVKTTEIYPGKPVPSDMAVRLVQLDIEAHGVVGGHCHSGEEFGTVTRGTLMLSVADAPFERKSQGESFKVPSDTWMVVKNETDEPARMNSMLIVRNDGKWLKHDRHDCPNK